MMKTQEKTVVISGNAYDLGLAIAMPYAKTGANIIVIIDQRESWHQETFDQLKKLQPGIVMLNLAMADENTVQKAITDTLKPFNGMDILVNNVGAVIDIDTLHLHPQQFDLMHAVNVRNTFMLSKICHSFLIKSANPHIINISPPLDVAQSWFKNHLAFSMSTYSMSMCTLGMSAEFKKSGIAVNSIWPSPEALTKELNDEKRFAFTEAVFALGQKKARNYTGNFCTQ